ncbi:glycosyltransferase [Actinopolyspora mortivallis]|uniref:Glycosyltransferase n=1 Tax=Actinopolyspora mortivallis TaxID=33906 RepID=A0A2T0GYZ6_ACTMO|nr:glycosyltransferase [Actinopolyspora mortivallis]PRW64329.1 glycosyltransferase [Actinopolyspora mortivallis]
MRIAFGSQPIYSHLVPALLPLARLTAEAGHEVVVLTSEDLSEEVRRFGLTPLVPSDIIAAPEILQRPDLVERLGLDPSVMDDFGRRTFRAGADFFATMFAGPVAGDNAEGTIESLKSFAPDLLVRESTDYASYYAAEYLGVRHLALDIGPLAPFDETPVLTNLNEQRDRFDLPPVSDPLHPFHGGRIGMAPESFYPPRLRLENARHHNAPPPAEHRLDPELAALPADRPLVLATLGSNAARIHDSAERTPLHTIVDVLGELPVTGVVALGRNIPPESWNGARPDNVHLTSFVQQQLLLPSCEVFITHGGFSGVREALSSGVPMAVLPMFAEQPANAERVAQLGVGEQLDLEELTHTTLRETVETVLNSPSYRHRARAMARRFLALPPFGEIVRELEEPGGHG